MPMLGLGVYKNDDCEPACLAALKHGYRYATLFDTFGLIVLVIILASDLSTADVCMGTKFRSERLFERVACLVRISSSVRAVSILIPAINS